MEAKKNKNNPVGVRFNQDVLATLRQKHGVETPQAALRFLEAYFIAGADERPHKVAKKPEKEAATFPEQKSTPDAAEILGEIEAVKNMDKPSVMSSKDFEAYKKKRIKALEDSLTGL